VADADTAEDRRIWERRETIIFQFRNFVRTGVGKVVGTNQSFENFGCGVFYAVFGFDETLPVY